MPSPKSTMNDKVKFDSFNNENGIIYHTANNYSFVLLQVQNLKKVELDGKQKKLVVDGNSTDLNNDKKSISPTVYVNKNEKVLIYLDKL